MGDLEALIKHFGEKSDAVSQIENHLSRTSKGYISLENRAGSQAAFLLAGLQSKMGRRQLYVATDKEEAAYMYNTLDNILGEGASSFFPDSFKGPRNYSTLDQNGILHRTEAVTRITQASGKNEIIVTYPEALYEKIVSPEAIEANRLNINKGENIDLDELIETLYEYGFKREDFVYEPGQYAIRGGIIDIFSFGHSWPYRIELFDDEIEQIKTFDPMTQLSRRNLTSLIIVPNVNTHFSLDERLSFLNLLDKKDVIWLADPLSLIEDLQKCSESFHRKLKEPKVGIDPELEELLVEEAVINPPDFVEELNDFSLIFLRQGHLITEDSVTIDCKASPQPSFNKNFKLLIKALRENTDAGIENYIFTGNKKQIERLYAIFNDLRAEVQFTPIYTSIHRGFIDKGTRQAFFTDHQIFRRFHRYSLRKGFSKEKALSLKMLRELQPGDYVTHIDHGIGKFSGLEKIDINGHIQESVRLIYKNKDMLYVSIHSLHKISKYVGKDGKKPAVSKLGSETWKKLKNKTKRKVKEIAGELIKLYAKRRVAEGFAFPPDGYMQNELEASFIYEDTPDQLKATEAVKEDLQKSHPMDRLICGDAGFGKTEVAIRGAFKVVLGGKQVAMLVPTTILALQHYRTFNERLKEFGVTIDYINRFRSSAEKRKIYERLEEGKIDIIIGTHALLNKRVKFKDLGLFIIDEEQKFGVAAKEKLRSKKVNVDTLTMTATPIPRTLQFALMSARDLSIMNTPPPNRRPIHTEIRLFNRELIKDAIYYEVNRGGQVFFVHNRVKSLPEITELVKRLCPDLDVSMAHGQMDSKGLEKTLTEFIDGGFDVLVCTNIIETGLDIPNANTMLINNAHHYGLSDLHQLRGRIGRSNRKAYCYLFCPPLSSLTDDARKRLRTLEEFSELGDGFNIAMRDLDIRGAGNLLGAEQSGFIADIGYQTYTKILEEAIQELKENEFKDVFEEELKTQRHFIRDVTIDVDSAMHIPDDYITNTQERLSLYTDLNKIEDEDGIGRFAEALRDRFGPIPREVEHLFDGLRLRWIAMDLGFERLSFKKNKLRCYFVLNAQSAYYESVIFHKVMDFISKSTAQHGFRLKQSRKHLILVKDQVLNIQAVLKSLEFIHKNIMTLKEKV